MVNEIKKFPYYLLISAGPNFAGEGAQHRLVVRRSKHGTVVIAGACYVSTLTLKISEDFYLAAIKFFLVFQQYELRKGCKFINIHFLNE